MKKVLVFTLLAVLFSVSGAEAAPNGFKDVFTSTKDDKYKLELRFDRTPQAIVHYYEKSIQMDVADGLVYPAKRVFDINHSGIKTINVYQVKPRLLRVRIMPDEKGMKALKESFAFTANGSNIVLSLGKKSAPAPKASEILTPEPVEPSKITAPVESSTQTTAPIENSAEPISAETKETGATTETAPLSASEAIAGGNDFLANIRKNLDDIKSEGGNNDKISTAQPNAKLASNIPAQVAPTQAPGLGEAFLKIASALMIVLAVIFIVSFFAKKYLGTMESTLGTKKQLKVLSDHFIGVKKNVTIIEVGGDILVLGVTNTNIGLLAHYTDPDKIELIKMAHRLPDKPLGIFKKFKMLSWVNSKKQPEAPRPANSQFARQVASYTETSAPVEEEAPASALETRKDVALQNVSRAIKQKLRAMEGTV